MGPNTTVIVLVSATCGPAPATNSRTVSEMSNSDRIS